MKYLLANMYESSMRVLELLPILTLLKRHWANCREGSLRLLFFSVFVIE